MNVLLLCLCGCESVFNVAEIEQRLWCLEFLGVQIYSLYILLPRCLSSLRRLFFRCLLCPAVPVCLFDLCSRGVNSTESLREDGWRGWGSVKERESDWVWVSLACSGPLLCRMNDGRGQEISDTSESKVEWKPYWGVNLVFSVLRYKYLKVRQSGITEDQCPPPHLPPPWTQSQPLLLISTELLFLQNTYSRQTKDFSTLSPNSKYWN